MDKILSLMGYSEFILIFAPDKAIIPYLIDTEIANAMVESYW